MSENYRYYEPTQTGQMKESTSTLDFVESTSFLAEEHVDWFLDIIRPLLISWFEHGYKHGKEDKDK